MPLRDGVIPNCDHNTYGDQRYPDPAQIRAIYSPSLDDKKNTVKGH